MGTFLAFLPSLLGAVGSLFKGNKTKMASQQTAQQQQAYTALLNMLMQRMKQGSDPMNQVRQMFYGQSAPTQQPSIGGDIAGRGQQARPEYDPQMYDFSGDAALRSRLLNQIYTQPRRIT